MNEHRSHKLILGTLLIAAASLAPLNAALAVRPLDFDIPDSTSGAGKAPMPPGGQADPNGISPLGFELPAPVPRGAQGPMRPDTGTYPAADPSWLYSLGGIGGVDSP